MESERAGIREFRENLARYIESAIPVAITRHGETGGLRAAGEQLDALIASAGTVARAWCFRGYMRNRGHGRCRWFYMRTRGSRRIVICNPSGRFLSDLSGIIGS